MLLSVSGIYGCGRAYRDTVSGLEVETARARARYPGIGIVWLVHFPPAFPQIASSLELIDEDVLVQAAERSRVTVLLTGHTHDARHYTVPGTRVNVVCAGSATQHRAPGSYEQRTLHAVEFTVSGDETCTAAVQTYLWSDDLGYWDL